MRQHRRPRPGSRGADGVAIASTFRIVGPGRREGAMASEVSRLVDIPHPRAGLDIPEAQEKKSSHHDGENKAGGVEQDRREV